LCANACRVARTPAGEVNPCDQICQSVKRTEVGATGKNADVHAAGLVVNDGISKRVAEWKAVQAQKSELSRDQLREFLTEVILTPAGKVNEQPRRKYPFALGCLIASAIEGSEEQLGSAALGVNPDSASEIAEAVLRLKNEPGLCETLIASGKIQASGFTADSYAKGIIDLLDSLELRFSCFRR
jgi:hypothetical protein